MIASSSKRMPQGRTASGSALIGCLVIVGILALLASTVFLTAIPAYRGTYHASAWHEARLAADAGVDLGVAAVQNSLPATNSYTWPGWTLSNGNAVPAGTDQVRVLTPSSTLLYHSGDGGARPSITKVEIDVITRDDNVSKNPWYRIRATGSAEIASEQLGLDKRDLFLRRISFGRRHVTRTVEVVARPVYLWEYALKTAGGVPSSYGPAMVLGGGSDWRIDSYDHRYPAGVGTDFRAGADGMYDPAYARAFGNVASNQTRPANSPIGVLIDAEGAPVRGEVQTHGGDNPDTTVHENVEQPDQIDPTRITSEFDETLLRPQNPMSTTALNPAVEKQIVPLWPNQPDVKNPTLSAVPFSATRNGVTTGTSITNPTRILLQPNGNQTQGAFVITKPTDGLNHFVEIVVNGNLTLGGNIPNIDVPPGVYAKIFVNGNIDFKNNDINYSATSSRVPGNVELYGVSTDPLATVSSSGNGHLVAVFYGPTYAGHLNGNTEIIGGFVLNTYDIAGGGGSGGDSVGAGFHYDEALGVTGPIQSYKVTSYFEDTRKDLD